MSYERDNFEHCGLTVRIIQDEDPSDPEEGDTPVYLCHFHRAFQYCGDELPFDSFEGCMAFLTDPAHADEREEWAIFLLDSYIHSGVHLTLAGSLEAARLPDRQWDVSQCGAVFVKKDDEWGIPEGATEPDYKGIAESHVNTWNQYLSGDVWGYIVQDSSEAELDSCWGFYGADYCIEEAKSVASSYEGEDRKLKFVVLLKGGRWEDQGLSIPCSVGEGEAASWALKNHLARRKDIEGLFLMDDLCEPEAG